MTEASIRALIRRELPDDAFAARPLRTLWFVPIAGSIVLLSAFIVRGAFAWWIAVPLSLLLGHQYGCLFFFGHELSHGAMTRSRRVQEVLLFFSYLIFALPPRFSRAWHLAGHHAHTNVRNRDTDTYGHVDDFLRARRTRFLYLFAPGSGHWLSAFYMFTFALQGQVLIWFKVRGKTFRGYHRGKALVESAGMIAFWIALTIGLGLPDAIYVVVIPALVANAIVLMYGATNHNLRPLTETGDQLAGSMSVTAPAILDRLHFHFSHHTEHHLFPRLPSDHVPLVRRCLERHARDEYLAPPLWKALLAVFLTPRMYQAPDVLVDPNTGRTVPIRQVEAALRTPGIGALLQLRRAVAD
jgi:fatty acid desaturase